MGPGPQLGPGKRFWIVPEKGTIQPPDSHRTEELMSAEELIKELYRILDVEKPSATVAKRARERIVAHWAGAYAPKDEGSEESGE